MDDSDASLVERAAARDAAAFDELVRRHRPGLVRLLAWLTWDPDEAESLAQEALTRAYARLADYLRELPFGAWLRGIALNLCRNHLRARKRHARPVAPEHLEGAFAPGGRPQGVLSGIVRREAGEQALKAIGELPALLREAFVLHFLEGMDYAEMSRTTQTPSGTLRARAHRARALLRDSLGPFVDTWLREGRDPPEPPPKESLQQNDPSG